MLAYPKETLTNLHIIEEAEAAKNQGLLSPGQLQDITQRYPVELYTPNLFVRIGLGILTFVIVLATLGLLGLITSYNSPLGLFFVLTALTYFVLERMTRNRKHFNSGVDNMLMIFVVLFATAFVIYLLPAATRTEVLIACTISLVCLFLSLRFTDSVMAMASALAMLSFVYYLVRSLPNFGWFLPLILIVASGGLFWLTLKLKNHKDALFYEQPIFACSMVALCCFYISGNAYFVDQVFFKAASVVTGLAMAQFIWWCSWVWTFAIPLLCIAYGIKKKRLKYLRLGGIFLTLSIITFRFYFAITSVEMAMLLAGCLITGITYTLIRYLQIPHGGFTFLKDGSKRRIGADLEGVIIGEVFGNRQPAKQDNEFGGGSFGGAGAGANF